MKRKPKTQHFSTVREFITANRDYIYQRIRGEYEFYHIDLKEMATDFLAYAEEHMTNNYTGDIEVKNIDTIIFRTVGYWASYRRSEEKDVLLKRNYNALNNFREERERAAWSSVSW